MELYKMMTQSRIDKIENELEWIEKSKFDETKITRTDKEKLIKMLNEDKDYLLKKLGGEIK
jgi:hypothetical protein